MKIDVKRTIASGKPHDDLLGRILCFLLGSLFGVGYCIFVMVVF